MMPTCACHPLPYRADPAEYFARVRHAPGAVLLDSGRPTAERGRHDLISAWPMARLAAEDGETASDFLQRLRDALDQLGSATAPAQTPLPFVGGLIGYLSYDFGRRLEHMPHDAVDDLRLADTQFGLYAWALVSDHHLQRSHLVFHPRFDEAERQRLIRLFSQPTTARADDPFQLLGPFQADLDAATYQAAIERIQAYIQAGDCYQVNFAQRFRAACRGDAWHAYQALRAACPTPFAGFLQRPDGASILSLSPERFLRVHENQVETRPIKGTRPRGATPQEDRQLAEELLASAKDRAENLMIVDLLRNDLGRSCRTGSVRVPELFALESYPNVHHLVSAVTGELADDKDALRPAGRQFPRRLDHRRAEDPRHADHRRTGADPPRTLLRLAALPGRARGDGQLDRHPQPAGQGRADQLLGRRRHRHGLRLAGRIPGIHRQGRGSHAHAGSVVIAAQASGRASRRGKSSQM